MEIKKYGPISEATLFVDLKQTENGVNLVVVDWEGEELPGGRLIELTTKGIKLFRGVMAKGILKDSQTGILNAYGEK